MEQPMFVPGDIAECVDSSGTEGLIQGKKYKIENVGRCRCGVIFVEVVSTSTKLGACDCGEVHIASAYYQRRFAFPEEVQHMENAIHQALKGIPETL